MGVCMFFMLEIDEENHSKMWSDSMPILTVCCVRFYKKIRCAQSVRSHVCFSLFFVFFIMPDLRSARAGAVETQFSIFEVASEKV